jgi:uncharacterized protein
MTDTPAVSTEEFFRLIGSGDLTAVQHALRHDPSLADARNAQGVPATLWALYHERGDLAAWLAPQRSALDLAEQIALGHVAAVRERVEADPALLQARSADGFTMLGLAVFFRQGALARWMIEQGADVNACADNAMRVGPIHAAVARGDLPTLQALLDAGADPDIPQARQVRPIHDAALGGKSLIAALLYFHGADLTARNEQGDTPATLARRAGHEALALRLERLAQD